MRAKVLSGIQLEQLKTAIVYLKMDELRALSKALGVSAQGQKRELIAGIMATVERLDAPAKAAARQLRRCKQEYSLDATLEPDSYANGRDSRTFLKQQIGEHFHFTTYGMDWIKAKWDSGVSPTFREFIAFWKQEYLERKKGKAFVSKPELARVNFFRRLGEFENCTKADLESKWATERMRQVETVRRLLGWK